jgi:hypothetical protein
MKSSVALITNLKQKNMSLTSKNIFRFFLLTVILAAFSIVCFAQNEKPRPVPKEVQAIVGEYQGTWTSYALDEKGEIVKRASWTDVVKAENPTFGSDRISVTTTDEMTFDGGKIPPMKIQAKEGFMLNADGSLGDYFIETFGQTYRMLKLNEATRVYSSTANPREYPMLGAVKIISAQHCLVKVVTFEDGVETHNISRVTTVQWKDLAGNLRTTQFVSLQGKHKRIK